MKNSHLFNHHNHLSEQGIALYAEAIRFQKRSEVPQEVRIHVEECDICKMQIVEIVEIINDIPVGNTQPTFGTQKGAILSFPPLYRLAAVFVIAALLAAIYFTVSKETIVADPVISREETVADTAMVERRTVPESDLFAANFEPSPNLEDIVSTEFRSASIEIISPKIGDLVRSPITFRWKRHDKPVTIKILSNKEITLISSTVRTDSFTTAKVFAPGLYYWKLESNDELLFAGKFLVR